MANILVIDDNEMNLRLINDMLKAAGHVVQIANNGSCALEMVAANKFDIVLTDLQMPKISGIEIMNSLKANSSYRNIPIVAVTAHAMQGTDEELLEAGFDAYLSKPLALSELLELVDRFTK